MTEPIKIIRPEETGKGKYSCSAPITKEQWLEILADRSLMRPEFMGVLLSFYFMPGHKASCTQCAERYGYEINWYNSGVSAIGKSVVDRLGSFKIVDGEGKERFWPVVMERGREITVKGKKQFEWTLGKALVEALEESVIQDAVERYIPVFEEHWQQEEYKWRAVQWFQEHWNPDDADFAAMIDWATAKTDNLLASRNYTPRDMLVKLAKAEPKEMRAMFEMLYDESLDLARRVTEFIERAEAIRAKLDPDGRIQSNQTTNAVSTYLWLRYPDRYYIYKSGVYIDVIEKLGLDVAIKRNGKAEEMVKGYAIYDRLNRYLRSNGKYVAALRERLQTGDGLYPDPELRIATIDFGFLLSRCIDSIEPSLHIKQKTINNAMTPFISEATELLRSKKNLILQGAPGTGKTYNTAAIALAIIDGAAPPTHREVMARYKELQAEGRIGFTTFHQSMDYEDFIEGIKPRREGDTVCYEVKDGIFKRICNAARVASEVAASGTDDLLEGMNDNPKIWKVSLGGTFDNPVRKDCMANGYIRIGWPEHGDFDYSEEEMRGKDGRNVLRAFMQDMRIGDIVVSCWSQDETDAIGVVTGDYEYRAEGGAYPRYREVRWIFKGKHHNIKDINGGKHMTLGTVYNLYSIALRDILDVIEQYAPRKKMPAESRERPFVLIIDEINRGNVSKIFGEMITLLEKDKRLADEHPVTLTLPYSPNESFGVPQNLYIIGTMNTTDRSTGTLDYAIRRRFSFLTLPANREVIEGETAVMLFDDVRAFIEKFKYSDMDIEDLMPGHSYFMADNDQELSMKMRYEVIPLVKEYIKDGILGVKSDEAKEYFNAWSALTAYAKKEPADGDNQGTPAS